MTYPGGKDGPGVYQAIVSRMPPHRVYVEPFLGGGAVMRRKRPAALNIGFDLDLDPAAVAATEAFTAGDGGAAGGPRYRFEVGDALAFLRGYSFAGDELVYCDPPYLLGTRRSGRSLYAFELGDERHPDLLDIMLGLPCMVMVSGYWSELYAGRLAGWHATSFPAVTRGGRVATEWLWCNFPLPLALHDYAHLGRDYRERERIRKKKRRWLDRLRGLPLLERQALLAALQKAGFEPAPAPLPGSAATAGTGGASSPPWP